MLGINDFAVDFATTSATFVAVDDGGTPAKPLAVAFYVEEEEMLVELELDAVITHSADDGQADLDLVVDGTNLGGADGLLRKSISGAGGDDHVLLRRIIRLAKGQHLVGVEMKTPAGTATISGATWAAQLRAKRVSHNGTLGHGVDAKAQLVQ